MRGRRRAALAVLAFGLVAVPATSARAEPSEAWLASSTLSPVEQRVAVAAGPERTTVWTSLRFTAPAGPVAMIVPVAEGAAIDLASDAWMEALEAATAPRVLPPDGVSSTCPGAPAGPSFHVEGTLAHEITLTPDEITLLDDAGAVETWASAHGLVMAKPTADALGAASGERFVAIRFTATGGPSVTPTLRVAANGAAPSLPLALVRAGSGDLRVTMFLLGDGRATLAGTTATAIDAAAIHWNASTGDSTYADARHDALAAALADGVLVESAGHASLTEERPFAGGEGSVDAVVTSYFERAAAYGDLDGDAASCASQAAVALASSAVVGASCARGQLDPPSDAGTCAESPLPGQLDPSALRCGPRADDLAVALSGLAPASTWLTRATMLLPAGTSGTSRALAFADHPEVVPIVVAGAVDWSDCAGQDGGSGSSATSGSGSSGTGHSTTSGGAVGVGVGVGAAVAVGAGAGGYDGDGYGGSDAFDDAPIDDLGCDCSGTSDTGATSSSDGCGSDTSDTSSDGCASDTSDTSSDGCASDTSDTSSDGCGSDTSGSGDDCSGDTAGSSGDGCSSSSGDDCSVTHAGRRARPRLSALAFALMFVLAPLRRAKRPARRKKSRA